MLHAIHKLFNLFLATLISLSAHSQNLLPSAEDLLPNNHGNTGISVLDANTVWAACGNLNFAYPVSMSDTVSILKTFDGGLTWQVKKISNYPGYFPMDIFALNDDTAFVSLNSFGYGRRILRTTDGGNTWSAVYGGQGAGVWVKFFNDLDGVILNTGSGALTNDGGLTWQSIPGANIPAFLPGEYTGLSSGNNSCVVKGNSIWFGTSQGRVFRSNDKGNNWSVSNTAFGSNAIIKSVAFKDSLTGIAAGGSLTNLNITTDGGQSWSSQTLIPPIPIDNIEFVEGTDSALIAACDWYKPYNNRRAAYSKDFGKSWTVFNSFIPFGGMEFISPTVGFLGSAEYLAPVAHDIAIYKWDPSISLGINELFPKIELNAYPNPFIDIVNLEFNNKLIQIEKVEVINSSGQLCNLIIPLSPNNYHIDLSDLRPGIYQIVLHTNKGNLTKRLIKPQ